MLLQILICYKNYLIKEQNLKLNKNIIYQQYDIKTIDKLVNKEKIEKEDDQQQLKPQNVLNNSESRNSRVKYTQEQNQNKSSRINKGGYNQYQVKPQQLSRFSKGKTSSEFNPKFLKNGDNDDKQSQMLIESDNNSSSESKKSQSQSSSESKTSDYQSIQSLYSQENDSQIDKEIEQNQQVKSKINIESKRKTKLEIGQSVLSIEDSIIKEDKFTSPSKQNRNKQKSVSQIQQSKSNKQIPNIAKYNNENKQSRDNQQIKEGKIQFITKIKTKNTQQKINLIKSYLAEDSDEDIQTQNKSIKQNVSNTTIQFLQENILDPFNKDNFKAISFSNKQVQQKSNERLSDRQIQFFEKTVSTFSNDKKSEHQIQFLEKTLSINSPLDEQQPRRTCLRSKTTHLSKKDKMKKSTGNQNSNNNINLNHQNNNNIMLQSIEKIMREKSSTQSSKQIKIQNSPKSQANMLQSNNNININNNNNSNSNHHNNNHNNLNVGMTTSHNKDKNQLIKDLHSDQVEQDEQKKIELNDLFMTTYFEKMKIFKIYFPNNNVNSILEQYNRYCIKKFLVNRSNQQKNSTNQSSIIPVIGHSMNAFSFINSMKKRILNKVRHSIQNSNI